MAKPKLIHSNPDLKYDPLGTVGTELTRQHFTHLDHTHVLGGRFDSTCNLCWKGRADVRKFFEWLETGR